jgi:hypothetical protein
MWLITTRGFFSVVQHRDEEEMVLIRARALEDLESLCELAGVVLDDAAKSGFSADAIIEMDDADYRYRLITDAAAWAEVVGALTGEVTYPNFKSAVGARDRDRAHIYTDVWADLLEIQRN